MTPPSLDTENRVQQVVDGNAYILAHLRATTNGMVVRNILQEVRSCKLPPIMVFDGAGGSERRREKLPSYKTNRPPLAENLFATVNLIRDCLRNLPCVSVSLKGWEADDLIGSIAMSNAMAGQAVRVVTVDRDLYQLATHPLVTVTATYENIPPRWVRLYKTTVGDPSDRIPGISRFGEKAWESLNKPAMERVVRARDWSLAPSAEHLGMRESHWLWCRDNDVLLWTMWDVVGLIPVPQSEIINGFVVGQLDPNAMERKLAEFLL